MVLIHKSTFMVQFGYFLLKYMNQWHMQYKHKHALDIKYTKYACNYTMNTCCKSLTECLACGNIISACFIPCMSMKRCCTSSLFVLGQFFLWICPSDDRNASVWSSSFPLSFTNLPTSRRFGNNVVINNVDYVTLRLHIRKNTLLLR